MQCGTHTQMDNYHGMEESDSFLLLGEDRPVKHLSRSILFLSLCPHAHSTDASVCTINSSYMFKVYNNCRLRREDARTQEIGVKPRAHNHVVGLWK